MEHHVQPSVVTGGASGAECLPTSDREISADPPGKRGKEKRGKWSRKEGKLKKGGGKLKMEGEKVTK